jgi:hypothetical protein
MIANVLDEIAASAVAQLPGMITEVATLRNVVLDATINVVDWWKTDAEFLTVQFPALFLTWDGTTTRVRSPLGRQANHRIGLGYAVRLANSVDIKRHLTYVPEAILAWLDDFPITSRGAGKTIIAVAPKEDIEIQVDATRLKDGSLIWGVDLGPITVTASDVAAQLPTRPITHP